MSAVTLICYSDTADIYFSNFECLLLFWNKNKNFFPAGSTERDMWSLLADGVGTEQPCCDNAQSCHWERAGLSVIL